MADQFQLGHDLELLKGLTTLLVVTRQRYY